MQTALVGDRSVDHKSLYELLRKGVLTTQILHLERLECSTYGTGLGLRNV